MRLRQTKGGCTFRKELVPRFPTHYYHSGTDNLSEHPGHFHNLRTVFNSVRLDGGALRASMCAAPSVSASTVDFVYVAVRRSSYCGHALTK